MPFAAEGALREAFLRLGDALIGDFDIADFLDALAVRCAALDGVTAAGITVVDDAEWPALLGSSHDHARVLEAVQQQSGAGPLAEAVATGDQIHVEHLGDAPWARFADAAAALGYRSLLTVPLRLRSTRTGAITLYSAGTGPWPEATAELAQALADIAAMSIALHRASRVRPRAAERLADLVAGR